MGKHRQLSDGEKLMIAMFLLFAITCYVSTFFLPSKVQ